MKNFFIDSKLLGKLTYFVDDEDWSRIVRHKWTITENHQILARIGDKTVTLPRFILNYDGDLFINFIDGNSLNNIKSNFRFATQTETLWARRKFSSYERIPTLSAFKGVTFDFISQKWKGQLGFNHQVVYLGLYETELEAAIQYNENAISYFGEFAWLNSLPDQRYWNDLMKPITMSNLLRLLPRAKGNKKAAIVDLFQKHHTKAEYMEMLELLNSPRSAKTYLYSENDEGIFRARN